MRQAAEDAERQKEENARAVEQAAQAKRERAAQQKRDLKTAAETRRASRCRGGSSGAARDTSAIFEVDMPILELLRECGVILSVAGSVW